MSARATDSLVHIPQSEAARGAQAHGKGVPSVGQGKSGSAGFAQILGEQVFQSTAKAKFAEQIADKLSEKSGETFPPKSDFGMSQAASPATFASGHAPHATALASQATAQVSHATVLAPQATAQRSHATVLAPQVKAGTSSLADLPSRLTAKPAIPSAQTTSKTASAPAATEQPAQSTRLPAPPATAVKQANVYSFTQIRREGTANTPVNLPTAQAAHTPVNLTTAQKEQRRFPGAGPADVGAANVHPEKLKAADHSDQVPHPSDLPKTEVRPAPAPSNPGRSFEAVPALPRVPLRQTKFNPPAGTTAASSGEPARPVAVPVEAKPGPVPNGSPPRSSLLPNQTNTLQARAHFEVPAPRPLAETPTTNAHDNAGQAKSRETMGAAVRDAQNRKEPSPKAATIPIQAAPVPTQDKIAHTIPDVALPMAAHTKATMPATDQTQTPRFAVSQRRPETAPTTLPSAKVERAPAPPSALPQPTREGVSPPKQDHRSVSPSIKASEAPSTLPVKNHPSTIPAPAPRLPSELAGQDQKPSVPSPFMDRRPEGHLGGDFTNSGSAKPVKESPTPATFVRGDVAAASHAPVSAPAIPANLKATNAEQPFRATAQPNHLHPVAGGTPPTSHADVRHSAPTVATDEHPSTARRPGELHRPVTVPTDAPAPATVTQHPQSAQSPQVSKSEPKPVATPSAVPEVPSQAAPSRIPAKPAVGPQATVPATVDKDHPGHDSGREEPAPKPVAAQSAAHPSPIAQPGPEKPVILAASHPHTQPGPEASASASKDQHPIPSTAGKRRPRVGDDKPSDDASAEPVKTLPANPGPTLPLAAASAEPKHAKQDLPHSPERTTPTDTTSQSASPASATVQQHLAKETLQPAFPTPAGQPATILVPGSIPAGGNDWQAQDLAARAPVAEQHAMLVDRAVEDPGLSVTVMPHSAHLSLSSDAGDLSLHVRVRDGSADVNVTGTMAPLFDHKGPEVRSALAGEGLQLGSFATDQRGGSPGQQGHHGQPDAAPRIGDAPSVPSPRRTSTAIPEAQSADDRRIHVTA